MKRRIRIAVVVSASGRWIGTHPIYQEGDEERALDMAEAGIPHPFTRAVVEAEIEVPEAPPLQVVAGRAAPVEVQK